MTAMSQTFAARSARFEAFFGALRRYGLSAAGPVSTSAAHFLASLLLLRNLPQADFGRFSFLLIVVPFCLSASGAVLGAPSANALHKSAAAAETDFRVLSKLNLFFAALAGLGVALLMRLGHADARLALLFGVYGALMTLRWFVRCLACVRETLARAACSDFLYAGVLVAGLSALALTGRLTMTNAALVLVLAVAASFPAFGRRMLKVQFAPGAPAALRHYAPIWRDVTCWSLLGVALTELTANAHAYVVTFLSGPQSFALLALGTLAMRPVSLVLSALPDIERPAMVRAIAAGDMKRAFRTLREFRIAAIAVWAATLALAAILLAWFPHFFLKKGYDETAVALVILFWAAIVLVRAFRTPEAVFLQSANEYAALARVGAKSSVTSLGVTVILLLVAGPVASLGGILAGEAVIAFAIMPLMRPWKARHG